MRSAIFCWYFLFVLCFIKAASYVRNCKNKFAGLSNGPFDSMFGVMVKQLQMYLPSMVCADLDKFFILLKIGVCVI
jgi:hypothetical protein